MWSWNTCHPSLKPHPTLATALHAGSSTGLLCSWEGGAQNSTHPNCPNEEGAKALSSEWYQQASRASLPITLLPNSHPLPTYITYTCLNLAALVETQSCLGLNAILNLSVRICLPDRLRCSPLSNLAKRCPIGHPLQGPLLNIKDE